MDTELEKILMFIGLMGLLGAVGYDVIEPDMATLAIISYLVFRSLD